MLTAVALLWTVVVGVGSVLGAAEPPPARSAANAVVKLKDAKLNIEHNATDEDTGFQGFIDSEGWRRLDVIGPGGKVLRFEGRGALATMLGVSATVVPFTTAWNALGQPAASVPAGFTPDGLPLAVQLVGRPSDEATLLSLAAQIEAERPWAERRPPVS